MFPSKMTLPPYHMTAGESKYITIPIYTCSGKQIDAMGMTGRFAISDFVNINSEPLLVKDCNVIPQEGDAFAVLFVKLDPADTVDLYGKFIYQITGKDMDNNFGVMRGIMTLSPNRDKAAILT